MEQFIARLDEYGNGTVEIELFRYSYNGVNYIKAIRTVKSSGKSKVVINLPEDLMAEVSAALVRNLMAA